MQTPGFLEENVVEGISLQVEAVPVVPHPLAMEYGPARELVLLDGYKILIVLYRTRIALIKVKARHMV